MDEKTISAQNKISEIWAKFIKTGKTGIEEFSENHCLIDIQYESPIGSVELDSQLYRYIIYFKDCQYRKQFYNLWTSING